MTARRKLPSSPYVGGQSWQDGPVIIASQAAYEAIARRDPGVLKAIPWNRMTEQVKVDEFAGEKILRFFDRTPMRWAPLDDASGVIICSHGGSREIEKTLDVDPRAIADDEWELELGRVVLEGAAERVLLNAMVPAPEKSEVQAMPVRLPAGEYVIDRAKHGTKLRIVQLLRFRAPGQVPVSTTPSQKKRSKPKAKPQDKIVSIPVDRATAKLAARLRFVGTDGGPVLLVPTALLDQWHGAFDEEGKFAYESKPCDYDRASDAEGHVAIRVGKGEALVVDGRSVAFVAEPDASALLLLWVAGDAAAHVLALVRAAPKSAWKAKRARFEVVGDEVALIDSAKDGRGERKKKTLARGSLPAGRYAIDVLDEQEGVVEDAKGAHDTIARAVRLRPTRA